MPLGTAASATSPAPRSTAISASSGVVGAPTRPAAARPESMVSASSPAAGIGFLRPVARALASRLPTARRRRPFPGGLPSRATVDGPGQRLSALLPAARMASGGVPSVGAAASAMAYAFSAAGVGIALDALSDRLSGVATGGRRLSGYWSGAPERAAASLGARARVVSSAGSTRPRLGRPGSRADLEAEAGRWRFDLVGVHLHRGLRRGDLPGRHVGVPDAHTLRRTTIAGRRDRGSPGPRRSRAPRRRFPPRRSGGGVPVLEGAAVDRFRTDCSGVARLHARCGQSSAASSSAGSGSPVSSARLASSSGGPRPVRWTAARRGQRRRLFHWLRPQLSRRGVGDERAHGLGLNVLLRGIVRLHRPRGLDGGSLGAVGSVSRPSTATDAAAVSARVSEPAAAGSFAADSGAGTASIPGQAILITAHRRRGIGSIPRRLGDRPEGVGALRERAGRRRGGAASASSATARATPAPVRLGRQLLRRSGPGA